MVNGRKHTATISLESPPPGSAAEREWKIDTLGQVLSTAWSGGNAEVEVLHGEEGWRLQLRGEPEALLRTLERIHSVLHPGAAFERTAALGLIVPPSE